MKSIIYVGIYRDGAKIKTSLDDNNILLYIRREFDDPGANYLLTPNQALEMSYALIKAIKELNESEVVGQESEEV